MLTARYKIPIESISYEHIEKLKHSRETERELEKIVKILESGELGYYPDLLKTAKDKLRQMNPKHMLVQCEPEIANRFDRLDPNLKNQIKNELSEWCKEMREKEESTSVEKKNNETHDGNPQPQATLQDQSENSTIIREFNKTNVNQKPNRIKSCDYAAWDKFDPDVEMKKMDVAIERERVKARRNEKKEKKKEEKEKEYLTEEEKRSRANALRIKGNEAFTSSKHALAIELYAASIDLHPTTLSLGNRAQVYIKQGQYNMALADCEEALRIDPSYAKGRYRKALALYNLKRYEEASEWFKRVLQLEPGNQTVHDYLTKLHSKVPVKMRLDGTNAGQLGVSGGAQTSVKIIELNEEDGDRLTSGKHGQNGTQNVKIISIDKQHTENVEDGLKITLLDDQDTDNADENSKRPKSETTRNRQLKRSQNEWGLIKQPCRCNGGEPEFIKQFEENKKKIKNTVPASAGGDWNSIGSNNGNTCETNKESARQNDQCGTSKNYTDPCKTNTVSSNTGRDGKLTGIISGNHHNPSGNFLISYENSSNSSRTSKKYTKDSCGTNMSAALTLNNKQNGTSIRGAKSSNEVKRKYNEFLNVDDEYKPASIVDIFGTTRHEGNNTNSLISEEIEIVQKSKRDNKGVPCQQKPKIEVLDSVDFEDEV